METVRGPQPLLGETTNLLMTGAESSKSILKRALLQFGLLLVLEMAKGVVGKSELPPQPAHTDW